MLDIMSNTLEEIFYEHIKNVKKSDCTNESYSRLEKNERNLKSHLNKKEKKLLLRIIDDKDLIKEEIVSNSFITGFKIGLQVGYESNKG